MMLHLLLHFAAAARAASAAGGGGSWANSTAGVHTFLTFDSSELAARLRANPADPRAQRLDFVWGADEWALAPLRAANPATRTSKYIPCCRDTQLQEFGAPQPFPAALPNLD